jgi:hypothetical protein
MQQIAPGGPPDQSLPHLPICRLMRPFKDITNTAATPAPTAPTAPPPQPWWLSKPPAAKPKPPAAPRGPKRSKTEAPPDQHTLGELWQGFGGYQSRMPQHYGPKQ